MPTRSFHYLIIGVLIALCVCFSTAGFSRGSHSFGGGSSWGGGHSSTSAPSSGWGAGSSSGWGLGRRSSSSTPSAFSGNRSTTGSSSADAALYQKAQVNHTAFTDRASAVSDFKQHYSNQYTSNFSSEPAVRPSYIPQTYAVGGQNVNIMYNQGYGGYGYYSPLTHAWMMYDLWSD